MNRAAPAVAIRLLERFGPADEALVGDLQEEFAGGRSASWFWRQTLVAIVMTTASDLRAHPFLAARAVVVGWITLLAFIAIVAPLLDLEIFARLYDWLIVKYGSRDLPMLWLTHYQFWMLLWASHLVSGWAIARLHRRAAAGAIIAFALTVMWKMAGEAIGRGLQPYASNWSPMSPAFYWLETAIAPLLLMAGGYLGLAQSQALRRRSQTDTSTT